MSQKNRSEEEVSLSGNELDEISGTFFTGHNLVVDGGLTV